MSTRHRSDDDIDSTTPNKKHKRRGSSTRSPQRPENVPLDVLKAEARERRNTEQDTEPADVADVGDDDDHCIICLQSVVDRTVLINCAHDRMCFACIRQWCEQSRRCPLCNSAIGSHLIHRIRSQYDYQKYFLPPLRTTPPPANVIAEARASRRGRSRRATTTAEDMERDELDRAIERRRWVYRHGLFAKHVASNKHTRFRPNPTPQQIASSQELQSRCQMFVRRELRVWPNLDVEFLTNFILSLAKAIDIRTEAANKLISEFLDIGARGSPAGGTLADHFVHELYSYLRSPFRDLPAYDAVVQYDTPVDLEPPPPISRMDTRSNSCSPGPSRRRSSVSRDAKWPRRREPSDPLEASPRDQQEDSEQEDWTEPPPTHSKGKGKAAVRESVGAIARYEGTSRRGRGRSTDQLWKDADDDSKTYRTNTHQHSETSQRARRDGRRDSGGDLDGYRERVDPRERRGRTSRQPKTSTAAEGRRKPAGWDNFFSDEERPRQDDTRRNRLSSPPRPRSPMLSQSPLGSISRSPYGPRRSSSPTRHHQRSRSSDSRAPVLSRPLTTLEPNSPEDNTVEHNPTLSADSDGPSRHGISDTIHQGDSDSTRTEQPVRSRPARLAPIDAIRKHLKGSSRNSKARLSDSEASSSRLREKNGGLDLASSRDRRIGPVAKEELDISTQSGLDFTIPDRRSSSSSPNKANADSPDDMFDSRHETATSDNTSIVSYNIRGAAARPKSQLAHRSAADSTQRASPRPPHGDTQANQARPRLLTHLEATNSMDTISNSDIAASHLAQKPPHRPSQSEISGSPVSEAQIAAVQEEERLRLMARSRLAHGATAWEEPSPSTPQGSNVGRSSNQEKKGDHPNMPAGLDSPTAAETERRLRLQARLAARKREITALMGAASSADALPRGPLGGSTSYS